VSTIIIRRSTLSAKNIALTKESGKFHIMKCHADQALQKLAAKRQQFDLVFLDPPYAKTNDRSANSIYADSSALD